MSTAAVSTSQKEFVRQGACQEIEAKSITLQKDQVYTWADDRDGLEIVACEGKVWLTETGEAGDVILSRGDRYRVRGSGRVVAQGLGSMARIVAR